MQLSLLTFAGQVIIMDELSSRDEVAMAQEIANKGVSLIASAHAPDLISLMDNPELKLLLGATYTTTLKDSTAMWVRE